MVEIARNNGAVMITDCYGGTKAFLASKIIGGRTTGGQVQLFIKGMPEEVQIDVTPDCSCSENYARTFALKTLGDILEIAEEINRERS